MDVLDLQQFYNSPLGGWVRRLICSKLRELWPQTKGEMILGLGYCLPYLSLFREEAARVVTLMPPKQGAIRWPLGEPCLTALSEVCDLPFADGQFDRILLIHGLEAAEQTHKLLREAWRVLRCHGQLLMIIPNRQSIWSRIERTPFGQGYPYTLGQVLKILRENFFMCTQNAGSLYIPPTRSRFLLSCAPTWEKVGKRWFPRLSGVLMVEAVKQIYAGTPVQPLKWSGHSKPILLPVS